MRVRVRAVLEHLEPRTLTQQVEHLPAVHLVRGRMRVRVRVRMRVRVRVRVGVRANRVS